MARQGNRERTGRSSGSGSGAGLIFLVAAVVLGSVLVSSPDVVSAGKPVRPDVQSASPDYGPSSGGTGVTITGDHFDGDDAVTKVTFDATEAAFTIDSATQLTAVSPPHAAAHVKIQVYNSAGSDFTWFDYLEEGPPTTEPTASPTTSETPPTSTTPATTSTTPTTPPPSTSAAGTTSASSTSPPANPSSAAPTRRVLPPTEAPTDAPSSQPPTGSPEPVSAAPSPIPIAGVLEAPPPMGDCTVAIIPNAPGARIVVPFPEECGIPSIVVNLPNTTGLLHLSLEHLAFWPTDIPLPELGTPPAFVFRAELRDQNGTEVEPAQAVVQVRVTEAWLAGCPADACSLELFHYHAGAWARHPMSPVDRANGTVVLEAVTPGFSLFAVAGAKSPTVGPLGFIPEWAWMAIPVAAVAVAGVGVAARRREETRQRAVRAELVKDVDGKVGKLLTEMKNKEELLQFVNNAAHDLANPLTPILLQLDLLSSAAEDRRDDDQQKSLEVVRRNVEQLNVLITDLRDAAKLQAGKLRLFPATMDIAQLVRGVAESYEATARQARLELLLSAPQPILARADGARLTQVLTNLLNNAIKFTPAGGRVTVQAVRDGDEAVVRVRDTGLGLSLENRLRLFKPFSQVHGDSEKKKGTGLGLYIAKGILEAHGGRIGCVSEGPGRGATFWFTVPIEGPSGAPGPN